MPILNESVLVKDRGIAMYKFIKLSSVFKFMTDRCYISSSLYILKTFLILIEQCLFIDMLIEIYRDKFCISIYGLSVIGLIFYYITLPLS